MKRNPRINVWSILAIIIFGIILWSIYKSINIGRKNCKEQCIAQGACDFVWIPDRKYRDLSGAWTETEAKCTCITGEEKKEFEKMKEAIRKHNRSKRKE